MNLHKIFTFVDVWPVFQMGIATNLERTCTFKFCNILESESCYIYLSVNEIDSLLLIFSFAETFLCLDHAGFFFQLMRLLT